MLTDRQMLQYMGRENLEDYNAEFLIQLESWEAAIKSGLVSSGTPESRGQHIEISKLLGWTRQRARLTEGRSSADEPAPPGPAGLGERLEPRRQRREGGDRLRGSLLLRREILLQRVIVRLQGLDMTFKGVRERRRTGIRH